MRRALLSIVAAGGGLDTTARFQAEEVARNAALLKSVDLVPN